VGLWPRPLQPGSQLVSDLAKKKKKKKRNPWFQVYAFYALLTASLFLYKEKTASLFMNVGVLSGKEKIITAQECIVQSSLALAMDSP
jgi:hypothetical protein